MDERGALFACFFLFLVSNGGFFLGVHFMGRRFESVEIVVRVCVEVLEGNDGEEEKLLFMVT
jgi:hypothetical protein